MRGKTHSFQCQLLDQFSYTALYFQCLTPWSLKNVEVTSVII